jgi:hypothetical protein
MICVFGAFVLGDLRVLRVIGLGMAVAVLLVTFDYIELDDASPA